LAEVRGWITEDGRRRTEDGGQRTDVRKTSELNGILLITWKIQRSQYAKELSRKPSGPFWSHVETEKRGE